MQHILDAADFIREQMQHVDFESFMENKLLYGAVVYYTMVMGEAANKLTREFVIQHPETPWQSIANMRHHLVHGYYQVDIKVVWEVVQNDIPVLRNQVARYLAETDWSAWEQKTFDYSTGRFK